MSTANEEECPASGKLSRCQGRWLRPLAEEADQPFDVLCSRRQEELLANKLVNKNLTAAPLTGIKSTRGVIKIIIISSSTESDVTTNFAPNIPTPGIRAWATHVQKL